MEIDRFGNGRRIFILVRDNITSRPICKNEVKVILNSIILRHGIQITLHSDQGSQFESEPLKSKYKRSGIHKTISLHYHPRGYGQAKRYVWTIKTKIRSCSEHH